MDELGETHQRWLDYAIEQLPAEVRARTEGSALYLSGDTHGYVGADGLMHTEGWNANDAGERVEFHQIEPVDS